jgi:hypothetical protein
MKNLQPAFHPRLSVMAAAARYAARLGLLPPRLAVGPFDADSGMVPPRSLADLASYGVFVPDAIQSIRQPLYDRLVYPNAGVAQLRFFQQPQGQGNSSAIGGTGAVKTLDDTNMEAAGQLPSPKAFLATSIEVIVDPGSISTANAWSPIDMAFLTNASAAAIPVNMNSINDVNRILIGSWLDFFVGSQSYLTVSRGDSFPVKSYVSADTSTMVSGNLGVSGVAVARAVGRPFYLNPPILLMPNVNFVITLNWGVVVATPTAQNARISTRLDGIMYRNAQ